jgi:pyrroline-5-carboxylate reductase
MTHELAILGAGNMAEAIVRGLLSRKTFAPNQIIAADPSPQRRGYFTDALGVAAVEHNAQAAQHARIVLLSVKPQQAPEALGGLAPAISTDALLVSIMAGVTTAKIAHHLGGDKPWRIVRSMPNTPMLVGEGMVAIAPGAHANAHDLARAKTLFEAAASVIEVTEDKLDAVTAISGSGPAYFYFLVEQMIRAGVELGLTPEQAHTLATRTAAGTAKMMTTSTDAPAELRRKVTSPGGTTQAAIEHMVSNDWPRITVDALKAAAKRSAELSA